MALALLAGCVETKRPDAEACGTPTIELSLQLTDEGLAPDDPAVCRDQHVTLVVASEVDGVLHLHGYDAEVPAAEVRPGETLELEFDASRSGQFPIELHSSHDPAGIGVGVFTVHEP